jgi:hypothetical protein
MRCERAQELLSEYFEGTIQNALRVPLESHINACSSCREAVDDLRFVWRVLDDAPVVNPPAGFRASVLQRLEAKRDTEESGWLKRLLSGIKGAPRSQVLAWGAAALAVVVLAGITVPGTRSAAWFGLGYRGDTRAQFIAAQPRVELQNGRPMIVFPLQITNPDGKLYSGSEVRVSVRVIGAPSAGAAPSTLNISGREAGIVRIPLDASAQGAPVTVEVTRLDGGEPASQILSIPVPKP